MENQPTNNDESDSLEIPDTGATGGLSKDSSSTAITNAPKKNKGLKGRIRDLIGHFNIYLLLFVLIVVVVAGFTMISIQRNKQDAAPTSIDTQTLSPEALSQLNNANTSVGDPKQTLSIESNAVFSGKVLVRDSLDVAGTLRIGGALTLPGLTVAGTSAFDQIQANKISSSGDVNVQGQLTGQKGLTISGGASFGGPITAPQLTVTSFQLTGDLQLQRHIDAGGATPGKTDGTALGSGGTASVSGTDTAGTITINTGGGPGAGCFVTVNFVNRFNSTPHVVVTPVGSAAGGLSFYISRTTSSFTLCTANPAPGGANFSFDYIAID